MMMMLMMMELRPRKRSHCQSSVQPQKKYKHAVKYNQSPPKNETFDFTSKWPLEIADFEEWLKKLETEIESSTKPFQHFSKALAEISTDSVKRRLLLKD